MKTQATIRRVMTTSEIAGRVNALAPKFLEGLAPQDIEIVLGAATLRRFPARSLMAIEGHSAEKMFMLLEGQARTFSTTRKGEKIIFLWAFPGEMCGGRAFLSRSTEYLASTEAVKDTFALVWDRSAIVPLARKYPRLLENALLIASDIVESCYDLHVVTTSDSASQRVSRVLEGLAKGIGRKVGEGIEIHISNEEVANEANVTIFTVSRLLSEWHRKGFIVKSRGRVVILSREVLVGSAR